MTKHPVTEPRIPLATPREYCDHVGITLSQAAQMRYLGTGPEFIKIGRRVRYRWEAIEVWLEERTRKSTGDDRRPASTTPPAGGAKPDPWGLTRTSRRRANRRAGVA